MGYSALAITDECSLAGVVRAHTEAKECGLKLLIGSQFKVEGALECTLTLIACNINGYGNLSQFITKLRRCSEKGTYHLTLDNITGAELTDCVVLMSPDRLLDPSQLQTLGVWLLQQFMGRCWLSVEQLRSLDDEVWLYHMTELSLAHCDSSGGHRRRAHACALPQALAGRSDSGARWPAALRVWL
jgi:error-prone DNA polymerase